MQSKLCGGEDCPSSVASVIVAEENTQERKGSSALEIYCATCGQATGRERGIELAEFDQEPILLSILQSVEGNAVCQ